MSTFGCRYRITSHQGMRSNGKILSRLAVPTCLCGKACQFRSNVPLRQWASVPIGRRYETVMQVRVLPSPATFCIT